MLIVKQFGDRKIITKGVGKLFYQDGLPIAMSIHELKKQGYEVSLYHIADECLNNGWKPKTVYNKLVNELEGEGLNKEDLYKFCFSEYEKQREMIFNYFFNNEESAIDWFNGNFFKDKVKHYIKTKNKI